MSLWFYDLNFIYAFERRIGQELLDKLYCKPASPLFVEEKMWIEKEAVGLVNCSWDWSQENQGREEAPA